VDGIEELSFVPLNKKWLLIQGGYPETFIKILQAG
jgi:hypothetical protein